MKLHKLIWPVMAVVALVLSAPVVRAQGHYDELPFADPFEFDPDWQWFAPVDMQHLEELSPKKRANTGWFGAYDVTRLWVTRPESANTPLSDKGVAGDWGTGHRLDLGFMRENGHGWTGGFRSIGVSQYHVLLCEIEKDLFDVAVAQIGDIIGGSPFNYRAFPVRNSINVGNLTSFELNKTWRKQPYRYGGIFEPLMGIRYGNFRDTALAESFLITEELEDPADPDSETIDVLNWNSNRTITTNRMLGGQAGFRYFTNYRRWKLSGEFRGFLVANFQTNDRVSNSISGTDDEFTTVFTSVHSYRTEQSGVWGYEIRLESAYQVTKNIALRGGLEAINFGRGIWRGGFPTIVGQDFSNRDEQKLFLAGFTFGAELNR